MRETRFAVTGEETDFGDKEKCQTRPDGMVIVF